MYLFKTGLGQAYKPRSRTPAKPPPKAPVKPPPKVPADRLLEIYVHWELKVPFRKDLGGFRQEVVKAIGKHVAAHEKTGINAKLASKYLDTIFCIKFARYLVRSILLLHTFNPDAL